MPIEAKIQFTLVRKTYDGTKDGGLILIQYILRDRVSDDTLYPGIDYTNAEYTTADSGTNKQVKVYLTFNNDTEYNNYTIIGGTKMGDKTIRFTIQTGIIEKKELFINTDLTIPDKIYDGTTNVSFNGGDISGFVNNESFTLIGSVANKNVDSNKAVTFTINDPNNYFANYYYYTGYGIPTNKIVNIIQRPLTITEVTASNKEYDGTTAATFSNTGTLSGLVNPETLTHSLVGAFASASAGSRTVTATVTLNNGTNGELASNYSITNPITTSAIISKKTLTVNGDEVSRKPYDGNLTATLSGTPVLAGIVSNDTVTINTRTATYDNVNASINNKTVTIVTTLSGTAAGNYIVNDTTTTGKIDPKLLSVSNLSVNSRTYDGTTVATITGGNVDGIIGGEITASLSASFASKNAIAGQIVTATMTLSNGNGLASNYSVPTVNPTTRATITAKPLTITGVTAADKIFDGTTVASFSNNGKLNGLVSPETLTTTLNGSFADTDLGTSKPVTARVTLADGTNGGLASNYSITNPTGLTASIIAPFVFRYSSVKFSTTKSSSFKPSVFGEMTPTQWKILSKTLPSGITINSKTGAISGTAAARFDELSVIVYASKDSYTARYSLSIKCE